MPNTGWIDKPPKPGKVRTIHKLKERVDLVADLAERRKRCESAQDTWGLLELSDEYRRLGAVSTANEILAEVRSEKVIR